MAQEGGQGRKVDTKETQHRKGWRGKSTVEKRRAQAQLMLSHNVADNSSKSLPFHEG